MTSVLLSGLAAGYGIAIPVGAVALLIVGTSIRCGFACGFSAELVGTYARFVALTVINPLTVVYFTAPVLGSGVAVGGVAHIATFAVGAFIASLSWQTVLVAVGAFGRRGLSPRARVGALVAGNLLILGLALDLAINR